MVPASPTLPHPTRADLALSSVLFALSDPERLDVVRQLVSGPLAMADCALGEPSVPKSTRSHHMKVLREAGVIRNEVNGRSRLLTLRTDDLDARFPGLLTAVLSASADQG